jgi:glucose/arabinose dehydrogenase/chitodextrinase
MGIWRAADASQVRTRGPESRSLRLTLTGIFAGLLILVPGLNGATAAANVDDDGIFGATSAPEAGTEAPVVPANFQDNVVFSGLTQPTGVEFATNGRVFVAEKSGVIKVFDNLSDTSATVVADLNKNVYNFWDRGLLGMALDPANSSLYVLYTYDADIGGTAPKYGTEFVYSDPCPDGATGAGCRVSGRLSRINISNGAETVLINDWCQQFPSHSIGALAFGADGMLYVSGGDGASFNVVDYGNLGGNLCTDPPNEGGAIRSQDLRTTSDPTTLDGAVLRLDPATGEAAAGNPLIASPDANARRIIAYGLRNPFRFTIRPGTNEVWLGDVGWNTWEEINRVENPTDSTLENFGWPCYEGAFPPPSARQSGYDGANIPICETLYQTNPVTAPYYAYNHNAQVVSGENCPSGGSSISGLAFYQGGSYPDNYDGALFFSDYSRGCIWVMFPGGNGLPDPNSRATFVDRSPAVKEVGPTELQISPAAPELGGGDLFYPDYDHGTIRRVQYVGQPPPTTGLVAAYAFNEGTGASFADASGNGNGGTIGAATWTTLGKNGGALSFNGTTARATVPDSSSLDLTTAMTLEAWVHPTSTGGWRDVIYKGPDDIYYLEASSDTGPPATGGTFTASPLYGTTSLPLNAWSHLAATYDGAAIRIFVNGVQVASKAQTGSIATSTGALTIGGDAVYGQYFAGRIDDIRIYNTALTQAQIQADRDTPVGSGPPPDTEPPTAPTNLVATPISQSEINLSWTASTDSSGVPLYRVERCQGAGCSTFAEIGTTPTNSFNNTGLQPATTYRYRVRAQDGAPTPNLSGYSNIASATTQGAPNTPPTATISAPPTGTLWSVGNTINFSGSATDSEDGGTLPASSLSWRLVVQHCWQYEPTNCHSHTIQSWQGVASGSFGAPDHEYPAYLELTLTATDSGGLTDTETLRLDPRTVVLTFQTSPSGLQLAVGSSSSTATFTREVIVGSNNSVSAPSPQTLGGTVYTFVSWSDGGAAAHNIVANAAATYTATFQTAADTQPPTAPTNVTATAISSSQINLSWTAATDNVGVTQYLVERCEGQTCTNFVQIATIAATTYSDTGLNARTRYRYRIRAVDAANNRGPYSNIAAARTKN